MLSNPFTLVYDGLWTLLEHYPAFVSDVKVANRLKYNSATNRDPLKQTVEVADLPEVALICSGTHDAKMRANSSSSKCIRQYQWIINTGDFRLNEILHQIEWDIYVGMQDWDKILTALQWANKSFVKRVDFTDVSEGQSDPSRNRSIRGWTAIWGCEVEMWFTTSDLKALLPP